MLAVIKDRKSQMGCVDCYCRRCSFNEAGASVVVIVGGEFINVLKRKSEHKRGTNAVERALVFQPIRART